MKTMKRGPTLRRHKSTGHAYAKFNGKQVWFGNYEDSATHARFAAFKAEWEANGRRLPREPQEGLAIADLVARYLVYAEIYYRKLDGTPTHEVVNTVHTIRPLLAMYGRLPAADFDLRRLKLIREALITLASHGRRLMTARPASSGSSRGASRRSLCPPPSTAPCGP